MVPVLRGGLESPPAHRLGLCYCLAVALFFLFSVPKLPPLRDGTDQNALKPRGVIGGIANRSRFQEGETASFVRNGGGFLEARGDNLIDKYILESIVRYTQETGTVPSLQPLTLHDDPPAAPLLSGNVWVWSPSALPSLPNLSYGAGPLHLRIFAASSSFLGLNVFYSSEKICFCGDPDCSRATLEIEGVEGGVQEREGGVVVGSVEAVAFVTVCWPFSLSSEEPLLLGLSALFPL